MPSGDEGGTKGQVPAASVKSGDGNQNDEVTASEIVPVFEIGSGSVDDRGGEADTTPKSRNGVDVSAGTPTIPDSGMNTGGPGTLLKTSRAPLIVWPGFP